MLVALLERFNSGKVSAIMSLPTQPEIWTCAPELRETTDAGFNAKTGTIDQPESPGRNAPAGIRICGSLPGGLICHGGRSDPPVQPLPGGGRVHQLWRLDGNRHVLRRRHGWTVGAGTAIQSSRPPG